MVKDKMHRQYIRLTKIPPELIQLTDRKRYSIRFTGCTVLVDDYMVDKIKFLLTGIIYTCNSVNDHKPIRIGNHRVRKLHGDYVIAVRSPTEDILIDEVRAVKKELDARKIKYDDMCRWLCVS